MPQDVPINILGRHPEMGRRHCTAPQRVLGKESRERVQDTEECMVHGMVASLSQHGLTKRMLVCACCSHIRLPFATGADSLT